MSAISEKRRSLPLGLFWGVLGLAICVSGDGLLGRAGADAWPFAAGALAAIFGAVCFNMYAAARLVVERRRRKSRGEGLAGLWETYGPAVKKNRVWVLVLGVVGWFYLEFMSATINREHGGLVDAMVIVFFGPLLVAAVTKLLDRRFLAITWLVLAVSGLVLVSQFWLGGVDKMVYLFGGVTACCFAVQVMAIARLAKAGIETVGIALAGLVTIPGAAVWLLWDVDGWLQPHVIGWAVLAGVLAGAAAPLLEAWSIRHLTEEKFEVLAAAEPVLSMPVGVVLLGEVPAPVQVAGVLLLCFAIAANTMDLDQSIAERLGRIRRRGSAGEDVVEGKPLDDAPEQTGDDLVAALLDLAEVVDFLTEAHQRGNRYAGAFAEDIEKRLGSVLAVSGLHKD